MFGKVLWCIRAVMVCVGLFQAYGLAAQQPGTAIAEVSAVYSGSHHVLVEWTTLGEQSTDYFAVERSEDGERFREIGQLTGQGRTVFRHEYNFFDYRGDVGQTVYYRIREVQFGGDAAYTKVYVVPGLRVAVLPSLALTRAVQRHGVGGAAVHD